jgi:hypothetical protein
MRRKRFAGAPRAQDQGTPISQGFLLVRGIRFALPFRETITMAARATGIQYAAAASRSIAAALEYCIIRL